MRLPASYTTGSRTCDPCIRRLATKLSPAERKARKLVSQRRIRALARPVQQAERAARAQARIGQQAERDEQALANYTARFGPSNRAVERVLGKPFGPTARARAARRRQIA